MTQRERRGPLERYLSILEIVAASGHGLTLTEIANMMSLPKPTVHRLASALQETGALESKERRNKTLRIGRRLWTILRLGQDERVVSNFAQITCDRLAEVLCETCYIVRLGRDSAQTLSMSVPDQGYRLHVFPGVDLPSHAAASVKAILAHQSSEVRARLLRSPLTGFTSFTHTDMDDVMSELEKVRRTGFALCDREIDPNVMAYACPVFIADTDVIYSVGVTGPCSRLGAQPAEHWVGRLRDAAAQFGAMLAGITPESADEREQMRDGRRTPKKSRLAGEARSAGKQSGSRSQSASA